MSEWKSLLLICAFIFVPIFPDPYYHEEKVSGLVWIIREVDEIINGEANGYKPYLRRS